MRESKLANSQIMETVKRVEAGFAVHEFWMMLSEPIDGPSRPMQ